MRARADTSGLDELAAHLDQVDDDVMDEAEKLVSKGALNIKRDAAGRVDGYAHLPHYPRAISYDLDRAGSRVSAEIGPDKGRRQGPLGNIIEYGTINNAPIPHLNPALDDEAPRFERAVADLGERLLE